MNDAKRGALARVDELLSNRSTIPWAVPGAGSRERILAAIESDDAGPRAMGAVGRLRLAACLAMAGGTILAIMLSRGNAPTARSVASVQLDPAPLVTPALRMLTDSADASMESEARDLLDDADRLTRRVIAQLPLTGGR